MYPIDEDVEQSVATEHDDLLGIYCTQKSRETRESGFDFLKGMLDSVRTGF